MGVTVIMSIQSVSPVFYTIIRKGPSVLLHDQIFNVCVQLLVIHFHIDQPLRRRKYDKSNRSFDTFVRVTLRHLIYVYERKVSDFFLFAKLQLTTTDVSSKKVNNQNSHLACKWVLKLLPCKYPIARHGNCFLFCILHNIMHLKERYFWAMLQLLPKIASHPR